MEVILGRLPLILEGGASQCIIAVLVPVGRCLPVKGDADQVDGVDDRGAVHHCVAHREPLLARHQILVEVFDLEPVLVRHVHHDGGAVDGPLDAFCEPARDAFAEVLGPLLFFVDLQLSTVFDDNVRAIGTVIFYSPLSLCLFRRYREIIRKRDPVVFELIPELF